MSFLRASPRYATRSSTIETAVGSSPPGLGADGRGRAPQAPVRAAGRPGARTLPTVPRTSHQGAAKAVVNRRRGDETEGDPLAPTARDFRLDSEGQLGLME